MLSSPAPPSPSPTHLNTVAGAEGPILPDIDSGAWLSHVLKPPPLPRSKTCTFPDRYGWDNPPPLPTPKWLQSLHSFFHQAGLAQ